MPYSMMTQELSIDSIGIVAFCYVCSAPFNVAKVYVVSGAPWFFGMALMLRHVLGHSCQLCSNAEARRMA